MKRREINKYIKQNCASSWIYLRDYTEMQVNKTKNILYIFSLSLSLSVSLYVRLKTQHMTTYGKGLN